MTGVLPFLFFFTIITIIHNQGRTLIMSQSFTSMDARTQPFAVDSHVKHIDQDIQGRVVNSNHKDTTIYDKDCPDDDDPNGSLLTFRNYDLVPVYPEPEGDPSY